jgi:hypothetical protein
MKVRKKETWLVIAGGTDLEQYLPMRGALMSVPSRISR